MKIISWNINSVRLRLPLLAVLAEQSKADIICLQETKVEDGFFPLDGVRALGFAHVAFSGQKSYNGMAILSKVELSKVSSLTVAQSADKRHLSATLPTGEEIHNWYVPAGGDIPDPLENPAYDFKLRFVEHMTQWSHAQKKTGRPTIILGDFNIAPQEHDVWSSKQLRNVVSHTEPEITRLNALKASHDWVDVARHFVDDQQKLYSWWSYRNRDWRKSDRGRRLDHIWVTPDLKPRLKGFEILKDVRDWTQPSDHVPVVVELK
jgi:exodeoxyribonuclease III